MTLSKSRLRQLLAMYLVVLAIVFIAAGCNYLQTTTPSGVTVPQDPELDGPDDVVYVLDADTMQCYGIGSKYLATLPPAPRTFCAAQGPYEA